MVCHYKVISKSEDFSKELASEIKRQFIQSGLGLQGIADISHAEPPDQFNVVAKALRPKIMKQWMKTRNAVSLGDKKQVVYMSLEFLMGRAFSNNIQNMSFGKEVMEALGLMGLDPNIIENAEMDAGLGNGGLGRLAACYLDSAATLKLPVNGYGILYDYGIFKQEIVGNRQQELPDCWLKNGNPWLIKREDDAVIVKFGGRVSSSGDKRAPSNLLDFEAVRAVPWDHPIVGYDKSGNFMVNTLRLWHASTPIKDWYNMKEFNKGNFSKAFKDVLDSGRSALSAHLYPNDNNPNGKELRLKQQYFLVSATIQNIIREYKKSHSSFTEFSEKIAIQINDTHPALAVPELMRILIDEEKLGWYRAWQITTSTINYTNHTVLPEALESWPKQLVESLMPRNYEIIEVINIRFMTEVGKKFPGENQRYADMAIITPEDDGVVRMANLAIVGGKMVNGVAEIHSGILKDDLFKLFNDLWPDKFINVTNGVTQRRWLRDANPELAAAITEKIGDNWMTDLSELKKLEQYVNDPDFIQQIISIKKSNKEALAAEIFENHPVKDLQGNILNRIRVNPNAIFDVQAKRIHEYKRQLMNMFHIAMLYQNILKKPDTDMVPRVFIFAGKAAPGYQIAKEMVELMNVMANKINNDPLVGDKLKVVFMEDYNVTNAEKIIPATDLSEQISTVTKEASGTGNFKFALNGALTIMTMDGANVEMAEEIGAENMYVFGLNKDEYNELMNVGYDFQKVIDNSPEISELLDFLRGGLVNNLDEQNLINGILEKVFSANDQYLVFKDLMSYVSVQKQVATDYLDPIAWAKKTILNIARVGKFSSDRSVKDYNEKVWGLEPISL